MKTLIALFSLLILNIAHAEIGTIESYFSPATDHHEKVVHLYLQNNCNQEIFIATKSQNPNTVWETRGYIRVYPGQVVPNGGILGNIYYLNAFSADRRINWIGNYSFEIYGREVKALQVTLPKDYSGDWTTVLCCR